MPERTEAAEETAPISERIRDAEPGLVAILAEAEQTWRGRSERPGWRPFEDAFPTFYQFTNRPR